MLAIIVVSLTIFIDQLTKWWAANVLQHLPDGKIPLINGVLSFDYVTNDGMAWGLLDNQRWIFLVLTSVILAVILVFFSKTKNIKKHCLLNVAASLLLAGGASNMIDRTFFSTEALFEGAVVDFISFELIDFPIFNVADIAVCVGMGLFIVYMLFVDSKLDSSEYLVLFPDDKNKNDKSNTCEKSETEAQKTENKEEGKEL